MIVVFQDTARARRIAEPALNCTFSEPMIGLVIERDGVDVGAVILNGYTPGCNIDLTGVGRGAWTLFVVRDIARYCFARVKRVTARTSVKNEAAIKSLSKLGFKQEGIMREFFPDGDAVCMSLLRSEQKLIRL
ncbi:hypothetical protein XI02_13875 [Bradyrhizobium sp. CCBAU 21365]|nr:hypothetical protein XI02_13875 [Bradyrhizobium sp. CCBAU 21365]